MAERRSTVLTTEQAPVNEQLLERFSDGKYIETYLADHTIIQSFRERVPIPDSQELEHKVNGTHLIRRKDLSVVKIC